MSKVTPREWASINGEVIPQITDWYRSHQGVLSKRGLKALDRALSKATFAGPTGTKRLLEPAMILEHKVAPENLCQLAELCRQVPFSGDYGAWEPIRALNATTFRALREAKDDRADEIAALLSFPENGERPGPPVRAGAMANRLAGILIDTFDYSFNAPLKAAEATYLIARQRELMVMWAFGGSNEWPLPRIDAAINDGRKDLQEFWHG